MIRALVLLMALVLLETACTGGAPSTGSRSSAPASSAQPAQPSRTLVVAVVDEPKTLAARLIGQVGRSLHFRRIFNADLALLDDQKNPLPYLAEKLPQLNTDDWKVFPDGTMETTYHLRPNLVWHDGTPLTADDFVFSWEVFSTPELGQARSVPFRSIADVQAPDDRTILIHWTQPYADAGELQSLGASALSGLPPLPRHILGSALDEGASSFVNAPYWTQEYVGLGPYKLDRWEPGAFLEASAFDRHALGVAKIPHVKLLFLGDDNAMLASMLSGDAQYASNVGVPQTATLIQQWGASGGHMVPYFNSYTAAHFQSRTDFVSPAALQDRRVRQALAYAIDKSALNDALFNGQNLIADSPWAPTSELGKAANAAAIKYPLDLNRSAQVMQEAGFARPSGGEFYVGPGGDPFSFELKGGEGDDAMTSSVASGLRQAGFGVTQSVLARAQAQDVQTKSSYPGLQISQTGGGEGAMNGMGTRQIPGPENGWRGSAWDGYSNSEMDRLIAAFSVALDPADRTRTAADFVKLYTTDLPAIPLFFPVSPQVFPSSLTGPKLRPASSNPTWNIYEWELR